jgi:hypothetical protein
MHELSHQRDAVLAHLKNTMRVLREDHPKTQRVGVKALALPNMSQWQMRRDEIVGRLQEGYRWAQADQALKTAAVTAFGVEDEDWYVPNNQTIALFQSAMDEYLVRKKRKGGASGKTPQALAAVPEQFDDTDPGWLEVVWDKLKSLFTGKAKFIKHKSVSDFCFPLDTQAKVALVSDWGSGSYAAQAVAHEIEARQPNYAIHLGDVYYAGEKGEIKGRFLKNWPRPSRLKRSWALNGNHEMYSGGHGYFEVALKAFKQPASYFCLQNDLWRLIALDTGYVDHNLNREQVDWLKAQLANGPSKTILLTHHQLFSAYQGQGEHLEEWLSPLLEAGKFYAWFWGHEHQCVVYKPYDRFQGLKARCIGHGGIPFYIPEATPPNSQFPVEWVDRQPRPDNPQRGMHGFVLLTFDGPRVGVEYIRQDGSLAHSESFL